MEPIRTQSSNFMLRSQTPEVPDMPGERVEPGHIRFVWALSQHERDAVTEGLNIEVEIFGEPFPPVTLNVTREGASVLQKIGVVVADRYVTPDGRWLIRLLTEHGAELCVSREYRHRWSSWLALWSLKRALPTLQSTTS